MKYLVEFLEYTQIKTHENAIGILGDLGKDSKFGEQTEYFKRLVLEARSAGLDCFVFTDFDKAGLTSWELDGDNWVSSHRSLPKVFYDRSFRKKTGAFNKSNTRTLSGLGCSPINSANFRKLALDKHTTYAKIAEAKIAGLSFPYTEKFSKSRVAEFLRDRKSCVIKPRFGSGGRGIIKVSNQNGLYQIKYLDSSRLVDESELIEAISSARREMRSHKRAYVIQEFVDLPTLGESVFDVRVIYQRGKNGEPLRTGMAARVARPGRVTANLHRGGDRQTISEVLKTVFGQDIDGEIAQNLRGHAKRVFEFLDNEVGPIGEVGMDFLIDRSGQIHLIEVNSIPGRSLFEILPSIREKSIRRPIEYAQHLLKKESRN
jgi:glutathione synthase/RimK-type ligase-like ATP-grasp enzyme